jgi:hypothetical protein
VLMGTEPPTNPVFPPCGTTPSFRELQYSSTEETSCVDWGSTAIEDCPW